jgi:predicted SnoaL-like aldol condensation-catalyzing enzyme
VVVAFVRELDDPRKAGAKYTATWLDMRRIEDGKAGEHRDPATIAAPAPPAAAGGR